MTPPNVEELIAALTQTNQFHESADICTADVIAVLQSQAEHIAELERESETHAKAYGLAIVERDKLRHELKTAQEGWRCECSTDDACRFARERDALRAELAAIAATEPVAYRWVWKSKPHDIEGWCYTSTPPNSPELQEIEKLFTRPMPAQDVTELVEAVTCLLQLIRREAPDLSGKVMGFASTALSKYKGAK